MMKAILNSKNLVYFFLLFSSCFLYSACFKNPNLDYYPVKGLFRAGSLLHFANAQDKFLSVAEIKMEDPFRFDRFLEELQNKDTNEHLYLHFPREGKNKNTLKIIDDTSFSSLEYFGFYDYSVKTFIIKKKNILERFRSITFPGSGKTIRLPYESKMYKQLSIVLRIIHNNPNYQLGVNLTQLVPASKNRNIQANKIFFFQENQEPVLSQSPQTKRSRTSETKSDDLDDKSEDIPWAVAIPYLPLQNQYTRNQK